jgi:hypothetical protein
MRQLSFWNLKFVTLALAGAATSQQTAPPNTTTQLLEVDLVFPRNETYRHTEIIPIVLAVQNLAAWAAANSSTVWSFSIDPWSEGSVPGGISYDFGYFEMLPNDAPATDPTFLVAVTNVTKWYSDLHIAKRWGEKYMLQWAAGRRTPDSPCHTNGFRLGSSEAVMFDVRMTDNEDYFPRYTSPGTAVDILQATGCPQFNQIAQVTSNPTATATSLCPVGLQTAPASNVQGNPCAVTIDKAVASHISSHVARLSSSLVATASTTAAAALPTTRMSSAGVGGAARPLQTALAAACVLCGLSFS